MLRLSYFGTTTIPVEAECVTPDNLAGKTSSEIEKLLVHNGNVAVPLAEFFRVEGDASDETILVTGDTTRVKLLGAGMTRGRLTIEGSAGMHVGAEMTGGEIQVLGNVSDWVGAEMAGGRIHVHGNAGHLAGAGYRGSRLGMRGGTLLIRGTSGNEIGSHMRRGLIAVGGCQDYPGVSMIAGSIFVFGPAGIRPGAGMKRGTVLFANAEPPMLPSFRLAGTFELVFLTLYMRQLRDWGYPVPDEMLNARWKRYCGDLVALGKGEILTRVA
ncbi:MAG: formylmethanofuran dehydrogenase subunit C [Gemmataceae bacterium]